MLDGVQLLFPLLFSLALGFPPSLLSSSPVLLPLDLPLGQLGLPLALLLSQPALPLLLCLSCLLLLCPHCFNYFAFPVPAWQCIYFAAQQYINIIRLSAACTGLASPSWLLVLGFPVGYWGLL